jgi:glucose-6-phosphate dehydrogenase assembly protein OpcA
LATLLSTPGVWSAKDTTPSEVESALLRLIHERHNGGMMQAPARVLNLVVVVDRGLKDEVMSRLDRVGSNNPARTVVFAVAGDRDTLDATATLIHDTPGPLGGNTVFRERVEIDCGARHLAHLGTIVHPLLASEVPTIVWSPHGFEQAVDALSGVASSVLVDSLDYPDWRAGLARISELLQFAAVSDLAWHRSTPWRERLAAAFDPAVWRAELSAVDSVTVRMHPDSTLAALLYVGWLSSRLEWSPGTIALDEDARKTGGAEGPSGEVAIAIESDSSMPVPGLAGLTISTSSGLTLELNRDSGGLRAQRTLADGTRHGWTIIGASRGEEGILADGVLYALSPDELFVPAFEAACAFGGVAA